MAHSFEEFKKLPVVRLREIAAGIEHEAVQGYTQMHKDKLVLALCKALGLEAHAHHDVIGVDKAALKTRIRAQKEKRAAALASGDRVQLARARRRIQRLKRRIRKAMT
jgi:hypothetical protein